MKRTSTPTSVGLLIHLLVCIVCVYTCLGSHMSNDACDKLSQWACTGHSNLKYKVHVIQRVGLILDADWLKPHSSRCLLHKLPRGVFTAKVKGVYHFAITGFGRGTHCMILSMYKNSQKVISAFHNSSNDYYINMSNSVSLQLEVGENVYVQLRSGAVAYDDHDVVSTFSGHLLFPM
uniref:C1q domain-containing protein n=1 Tax=Hucho hucho TaxID=62062 RepID=A0A4W5RNN6_9TELE